jgi:hypothetical protein
MSVLLQFIMICPEGSEGVTYALLTTMSNLATAVAGDFGTALTNIWDVSNSTISSGDYSGVLKLTILCSILKIVPLLLLGFQPDSKVTSVTVWILLIVLMRTELIFQVEFRRMINQGVSSQKAGIILVSTLAVAMLGTLVYNIYVISQ